MAASGVGRGRGWLNINKSPIPEQRPGIRNVTATHSAHNAVGRSIHFADASQLEVERLSELFAQINTLDENDDGILFNQKLKNIIQTWHEVCTSEADVGESMKSIYQACLDDNQFGLKVIYMVTSNSFKTQTVHNGKIRNEFIGQLQTFFEGRKHIQKENPNCFRRSIKLLGEFFHKARLFDGSPIRFLATPLLEYLEMLLEAAYPEDLELFTVQLYLNGSTVRQILPSKLNELMIKVRHLLVDSTHLTKVCKLWMLLALDIANCRFGLLPSDIFTFYQEQLGDKAMAYFQGSHSELSVQTTQSSKTLEGFQSNVNVLQVTTPELSSPSEQSSSPQNNNHMQYGNSFQNFNNSKSFNTSDSGVSIGRWEAQSDDSVQKRDKPGRPILGAGARLNKGKSDAKKANIGEWESQNSSGWGSKPFNNGQKNRKGWEHDDRFENDYN